jgi:hypothetical protein
MMVCDAVGETYGNSNRPLVPDILCPNTYQVYSFAPVGILNNTALP